jgi:hypothetical protein
MAPYSMKIKGRQFETASIDEQCSKSLSDRIVDHRDRQVPIGLHLDFTNLHCVRRKRAHRKRPAICVFPHLKCKNCDSNRK